MLTLAPDLFTPALMRVWLDHQPVGTYTTTGPRCTATTSAGTVRSFGTTSAALAWLQAGGKMARPAAAVVAANQISLF